MAHPGFNTAWAQTEDELGETFRKWGVDTWNIERGYRGQKVYGLTPEQRRVTVKWQSPDGRPAALSCDEHDTPKENLRALYLGIESYRLNEYRGVGNIVAAAYAQLAAPASADPFSVLGVGRDASNDDVRAKWRELAQEHHPDHGGDPARFREITAARDDILSEREAAS